MVAVQTCPECGTDLRENAASCPQCGHRLRQQGGGLGFSIAAIICGLIAVFFFPYVFGLIGIVLGIVARSRGERWSTWAIVVPIVGFLVGMALAFLVFRAITSQ